MTVVAFILFLAMAVSLNLVESKVSVVPVSSPASVVTASTTSEGAGVPEPDHPTSSKPDHPTSSKPDHPTSSKPDHPNSDGSK